MNVESVIRAILSKHLGAEAATVSADTPVRALPAADSLKMLSVILEVEKYFDIEIPDDATFRIETIGEFDRLVAQLVAAKAADLEAGAGAASAERSTAALAGAGQAEKETQHAVQ